MQLIRLAATGHDQDVSLTASCSSHRPVPATSSFLCYMQLHKVICTLADPAPSIAYRTYYVLCMTRPLLAAPLPLLGPLRRGF